MLATSGTALTVRGFFKVDTLTLGRAPKRKPIVYHIGRHRTDIEED
jgi:hypothetical protein